MNSPCLISTATATTAHRITCHLQNLTALHQDRNMGLRLVLIPDCLHGNQLIHHLQHILRIQLHSWIRVRNTGQNQFNDRLLAHIFWLAAISNFPVGSCSGGRQSFFTYNNNLIQLWAILLIPLGLNWNSWCS